LSKPSPITVYNLLPKKNCGECKVSSCMAFALKLIEGEAEIEECPYLNEEQKLKLVSIISPQIKAVSFGKNRLIIGGERALHRHELRFFHPTAITINVSDMLAKEEIKERCLAIKNFKVERAGEKFEIDGIAVTADSVNEEKFKEAVKIVRENSNLPLVLCSLNPKIIQSGVEEVSEEKPILCSAKTDTLKSFIELSKKYACPIALESSELNELRLMAKKAEGLEILLSIDGSFEKPFELLSNVITIRRCGIEEKMREFSHPILINLSLIRKKSLIQEKFFEPFLASMLIVRYANLLILHSIAIEALLPIFILRQSIYANPRAPSTVPSGLYEVGKPNGNSPVLLTTNYALTYYLVMGDLESSKINCYLLVLDTQGMSVLNALAGKLLYPESIKKLIKDSGVEKKVSHRKLIIPGGIAKLKGEIEEATEWTAIVGPEDSSELPIFLKKHFLQ